MTDEAAALVTASSDDALEMGSLAAAAMDYTVHALILIERNFAGQTTPEWLARYREMDAGPPDGWITEPALWNPSRSWQRNLEIARDLIDAELRRATRIFAGRKQAKEG